MFKKYVKSVQNIEHLHKYKNGSPKTVLLCILNVDNKNLSAYTMLLVTEQIKIGFMGELSGTVKRSECSMDNQESKEKGQESVRDAGRLVNMISHQLKRQMCAREEKDSLTNMQRRVLHYILFQSLKREIYQKDVEQEFQIRRSTATGTLQLLEKNGFITRESVERDARLKKIVPTKKAKDVRERILGNIRYVEEVLKKDVSPRDLEICLDVLEQMSLNLAENEKMSGYAPAENGCAVSDLSGDETSKRGDNRP